MEQLQDKENIFKQLGGAVVRFLASDNRRDFPHHLEPQSRLSHIIEATRHLVAIRVFNAEPEYTETTGTSRKLMDSLPDNIRVVDPHIKTRSSHTSSIPRQRRGGRPTVGSLSPKKIDTNTPVGV